MKFEYVKLKMFSLVRVVGLGVEVGEFMKSI